MSWRDGITDEQVEAAVQRGLQRLFDAIGEKATDIDLALAAIELGATWGAAKESALETPEARDALRLGIVLGRLSVQELDADMRREAREN